jgi:DNA invertase Pin-like site-specific DNA recombinase
MRVDYEIDLDALLITHGGDPLGTIPMIGYLRVSTAREDMISPEMQADSLHTWACANRRRIVLWVADLDLSGRTLAKRQISGIIDTIADRTAPEGAREVGVRTFDRFGRNRLDNSMNLARLESVGGRLLSATEQVDAATAIGRFARGMLFEVAALKSDLIGEGWKEVHAYRIARGLPHTGGPRFGYIRRGRIKIGDTWVTDPTDPEERYALGDTWPQHARMGIEAAEGAPIGGIARWLNHGGIPSALGNIGQWVTQSVYHVLDSGFGFGFIIAHDPKCEEHDPDGAGNCRNTKQFPGAHPHVFADDDERDEVWTAYQDRRKRGAKRGRRAANPLYDFTGLITCRWCGRTLGAQPAYGRPDLLPQWRCMPDKVGGCVGGGASVAGGRVLYAVWDLLTRERVRLEEITAETTAHTADQAPTASRADRVADLQGKLQRARDTLDGLAVKHALGDIADDVFRRARDKTTAEETELVAKLAEAKAEAKAAKRPEEHAVVMRDLLEEWPTLPAWGRNKLLGDMIEMAAWRVDPAEAWVRIRTVWGTEEIAPASGRLPDKDRKRLQAAGILA